MIRVLVLCLAFVGTYGRTVLHGEHPGLAKNEIVYRVPTCDDEIPGATQLEYSNDYLLTLDQPITTETGIVCLNLAGLSIRIPPNAFEDLSELRYLNLATTPLSFFEIASRQLPKLTSLVLDGPTNRAFEVVTGQLTVPELQTLSLQNYGADGRSDIYSWLAALNIPKLTNLYLGKNFLNSYDLGNILATVNNLTSLHLDGNQLNHFDGVPMERLQNLVYMSLANNHFMMMPTYAFEYLPKLETLNLAGNDIMDIPGNTFTGLVNLENLALDNNRLRSVPDICELVNLRILHLSGNFISSINDGSFCNLRQLIYISLKDNMLRSIGDETFRHLPALAKLDLSGNKIDSLPENWIGPHSSLKTLYLDANNFETIESMSLRNIDSLENVSIGPIRLIKVSSLIGLPNSTTIFTPNCLPQPVEQTMMGR